MAIVLISSEMPELLTLSDRIVVMHRGRINGEIQSGASYARGDSCCGDGAG